MACGNTVIIEELKRELRDASSSFQSVLKEKKNFEMKSLALTVPIDKVLSQIDSKSQGALQQCQQLQHLHSQLQSIKATQAVITSLSGSQPLVNVILNEETEFDAFLSAIEQWKHLALTAELWNARFPEQKERFLAVEEACRDGVLSKLHAQLDKTLELYWNDTKLNDKAKTILNQHTSTLDTKSPLFTLFCGYPVDAITRLLSLPSAAPLLPRFPDLLFARLYAIINDGTNASGNEQPFTASLLESLAPEHLRYATRLSTILQSTHLILLLHPPPLHPHFSHKTAQIIRQVRKSAEASRRYARASADPVTFTPAHLNDLLNEISLIEELLSGSGSDLDGDGECGLDGEDTREDTRNNREVVIDPSHISSTHPTHPSHLTTHPIHISSTHPIHVSSTHKTEHQKWKRIAQQLERLYLSRSISTSLSQDRVSSTGPFPVSTCIDEIFFLLRTSLHRSPSTNRPLVEEQVTQLMKRIGEGLTTERSLIPFLILLNNAIQCSSHYALLFDGRPLNFSLDSSLERLHQFITPPQPDSLSLKLPCALTGTLAPAALEALYLLHARKHSTWLMTWLLESRVGSKAEGVAVGTVIVQNTAEMPEDTAEVPESAGMAVGTGIPESAEMLESKHHSLDNKHSSTSNTYSTSTYSTTNYSNTYSLLALHQQIQELSSDPLLSPRFPAHLEAALKRPLQALTILEAADAGEFDSLVGEMKSEGNLELRAGEILSLRERVR